MFEQSRAKALLVGALALGALGSFAQKMQAQSAAAPSGIRHPAPPPLQESLNLSQPVLACVQTATIHGTRTEFADVDCIGQDILQKLETVHFDPSKTRAINNAALILSTNAGLTNIDGVPNNVDTNFAHNVVSAIRDRAQIMPHYSQTSAANDARALQVFARQVKNFIREPAPQPVAAPIVRQ